MAHSNIGNDDNHVAATEEADAGEEKQQSVGRPGSFKNDPDDATNPNEAIERARRQVRP